MFGEQANKKVVPPANSELGFSKLVGKLESPDFQQLPYVIIQPPKIQPYTITAQVCNLNIF